MTEKEKEEDVVHEAMIAAAGKWGVELTHVFEVDCTDKPDSAKGKNYFVYLFVDEESETATFIRSYSTDLQQVVSTSNNKMVKNTGGPSNIEAAFDIVFS